MIAVTGSKKGQLTAESLGQLSAEPASPWSAIQKKVATTALVSGTANLRKLILTNLPMTDNRMNRKVLTIGAGRGNRAPKGRSPADFSRRAASAKSLKSKRFQSLHKFELRGMCGSERSCGDLSLTVYAQSASKKVGIVLLRIA